MKLKCGRSNCFSRVCALNVLLGAALALFCLRIEVGGGGGGGGGGGCKRNRAESFCSLPTH
jgi:hypothetical protein